MRKLPLFAEVQARRVCLDEKTTFFAEIQVPTNEWKHDECVEMKKSTINQWKHNECVWGWKKYILVPPNEHSSVCLTMRARW